MFSMHLILWLTDFELGGAQWLSVCFERRRVVRTQVLMIRRHRVAILVVREELAIILVCVRFINHLIEGVRILEFGGQLL